jgi:hypothetical protein
MKHPLAQRPSQFYLEHKISSFTHLCIHTYITYLLKSLDFFSFFFFDGHVRSAFICLNLSEKCVTLACKICSIAVILLTPLFPRQDSNPRSRFLEEDATTNADGIKRKKTVSMCSNCHMNKDSGS